MRNAFKEITVHLSIILLLILLLRVPVPLSPIFNVDEAGIATAADMVVGGSVLYRDIADNCAPLTIYFYALIFLLWGKNNIPAIHVSLIIIIFLIGTVLYFLGALIKDRKTGLLAALFFCIFSYTYFDADVLAFETEWLATLFFLVGLLFFFRYFYKERPLLIYLSGLFFGLAFFSKQFILIVYFITLCFASVIIFITQKDRRSAINVIILNFAGFLTVCGAVFFYFYANNSIKDFWFWFWQYNAIYYVPAISLFHKFISAFLFPKNSYFSVNPLLLVFFVVYFILTIGGTFRKRISNKDLIIDWYLLIWACSSYAAVSYSGRFFGHYYIILLPAVSIIAARTIVILFDLANKPAVFKTALSRKIIKAFYMAVIISGIILPLNIFKARLLLWRRFLGRQIKVTSFSNELRGLAEYLKTHSAVDDKIFVWGFAPEIYVVSNRTPASRYIDCNFLTGMIPLINGAPDPEIDTSSTIVAGSWETLIKDLNINKPLYIIDTSVGDYYFYAKYPPRKFKEFFSYLSSGYTLDKIVSSSGKPVFLIFRRLN